MTAFDATLAKLLGSMSPHLRGLGFEVSSLGDGGCVAKLPYRPELIGDPRSRVLHGGVVTTLLDSAGGAAVSSALGKPTPLATLDLRIDYLRSMPPERELIARVECYRTTTHIAFARGLAYDSDESTPVAAMAATYALNTQAVRREGDGRVSRGGSPEELRSTGDLDPLLAAIPYARYLGLSVEMVDGDPITQMAASPDLIGNPLISALHGGTVGALLESAAVFKLLLDENTRAVPKTINITIDYLRSGRADQATFARASSTKHGRRVANVQVRAWQVDEAVPIAAAHAHFLLNTPVP
jgi:uncharacterized protein (TIGR00369 family)